MVEKQLPLLHLQEITSIMLTITLVTKKSMDKNPYRNSQELEYKPIEFSYDERVEAKYTMPNDINISVESITDFYFFNLLKLTTKHPNIYSKLHNLKINQIKYTLL